MKIAIITLPFHTNYGGILQAYALQTVLERMGHQVEHLQPSKPSIWTFLLAWLKSLLKNCILRRCEIPIFERSLQRWIRKYTDTFINKHIHTRYLSKNQWNKMLKNEYDAFIVGSDQVWRTAYAFPIERYFFSFLPPKHSNKLIAYAASFGLNQCDFTTKEIKKCSYLLERFDFVSVREQSGISICKQLFNKEAKHVLDPTLLLQQEDYIKLIENSERSKGNLLVYILDPSPETDNLVKTASSNLNLTPFKVNSKCEDTNANISEKQQPPIEQWIRGFYDAEFVITDSFHGCIFAIIFNKTFICIGNTGRGSARFDSLFQQFGLEHCMISPKENFKKQDINWDIINKRLNDNRISSIGYLQVALKHQA